MAPPENITFVVCFRKTFLSKKRHSNLQFDIKIPDENLMSQNKKYLENLNLLL